MLVNLREILAIAEEKNTAIGAFNVVNVNALKAIIAAAEAENQPVIIQFATAHMRHFLIDDCAPLMLKYAKNASVPVCVHVDHGVDLEFLRHALDLGFVSIMYDGSRLPYEENVANTKIAVEMAKQYGATVEGEIGCMGRREAGGEEGNTGLDDETKIYTDPSQAKDFVTRTGVDALACSFGTTHGIYLTEPKLSFDIVRKVREATGIPVVMHGGSGVSPADFHKAIDAGVRKVNYFTYMDKAAGTAVQQRILSGVDKYPMFTELALIAEQAMKENVQEAIRVFARKD